MSVGKVCSLQNDNDKKKIWRRLVVGWKRKEFQKKKKKVNEGDEE